MLEHAGVFEVCLVIIEYDGEIADFFRSLGLRL